MISILRTLEGIPSLCHDHFLLFGVSTLIVAFRFEYTPTDKGLPVDGSARHASHPHKEVGLLHVTNMCGSKDNNVSINMQLAALFVMTKLDSIGRCNNASWCEEILFICQFWVSASTAIWNSPISAVITPWSPGLALESVHQWNKQASCGDRWRVSGRKDGSIKGRRKPRLTELWRFVLVSPDWAWMPVSHCWYLYCGVQWQSRLVPWWGQRWDGGPMAQGHT